MMPDDLEIVLDRCLADVAAGRETIDSCSRRYPVYAEQLAMLLQIAEQARGARPPAALPIDRRRALESRLLKQAGQLRSRLVFRPTAPRAPAWRRRAALALASISVVFLLLGSAVSVSAASAPGDFLYPVKRAAEQMRLTLASGQQQVNLYLEFARQRLQELRVLRDRGEVSTVLLAEISSDTARVLEQVPALPQQEQQALLTSLTNFQDQQLQVLDVMASTVQGDARAAVVAALADSTAKHKQAMDLLAGAAVDKNDPADGSAGGSSPARAVETRPPQGHPAVKPASSDTAEPQIAVTPGATKAQPSNPQESTPTLEHTPPGQVRLSTPHAPPGQVRQSTPHAPPGQARQPAPPLPPEKPTKAPKT